MVQVYRYGGANAYAAIRVLRNDCSPLETMRLSPMGNTVKGDDCGRLLWTVESHHTNMC